MKSPLLATANCSFEMYFPGEQTCKGKHPVSGKVRRSRRAFKESGCLGMQPKMGGELHLKLNTDARPIANKYREGKMETTLKRELEST